jgi:hypothetical protein
MSDQCLKLDMNFSDLLGIIEGGKHSLVEKEMGKDSYGSWFTHPNSLCFPGIIV